MGSLFTSYLLFAFLAKRGTISPAAHIIEGQGDERRSRTEGEDKLRAAASQFDDNFRSTHTNEGAKRPTVDETKVVNHIGKPLVALRPLTPAPEQQWWPQQADSVRRLTTVPPADPAAAEPPPSRLASASSLQAAPRAIRLQQQQAPPRPQQVALAGSNYAAECRWLTLREFSAISLNNEELLARDSSGQPAYLVNMIAYVKSNEANFIPLRNFRAPARAGVFRWWHRPRQWASQSAERRVSALAQLNCSVPSGGTASATLASLALSPNARAEQLLEQLTIQVDCGYLVLDLLADPAASGAQLELISISFYQNWGGNVTTLASPFDWRKHMVFTSNNLGPLIRMPQFSRYICAHRIELASQGQASVRLVLERFELQRLARQLAASAPAHEVELAHGFEKLLAFGQQQEARAHNAQQQQQQSEEKQWSSSAPSRSSDESDPMTSRVRRHSNTVILYKNPIVGDAPRIPPPIWTSQRVEILPPGERQCSPAAANLGDASSKQKQ